MPDYVILTDSSADLSAEMVREAGVTVLPLSFTIQGGTYQNTPDNREMDPALFYDMLRAGELATTSAVNVAAYTEAVEPLLQAGKDVLILAFSSGLSTTCNSAEVAAEELREQYPQRKLYVVDTLCASLGQGLLVWLAAREQKKGRSIEEVRDWAEAHKQAVCHQFTVQDLKFLKRGGRITATTAVLGSMLQIKPLLHVDQEGKLTAVGKARGRHAGDCVHQPRGLPRGRGQGGGDGAGALRDPGYSDQLHWASHRGPLRAGDSGPVLSGDGALRGSG